MVIHLKSSPMVSMLKPRKIQRSSSVAEHLRSFFACRRASFTLKTMPTTCHCCSCWWSLCLFCKNAGLLRTLHWGEETSGANGPLCKHDGHPSQCTAHVPWRHRSPVNSLSYNSILLGLNRSCCRFPCCPHYCR